MGAWSWPSSAHQPSSQMLMLQSTYTRRTGLADRTPGGSRRPSSRVPQLPWALIRWQLPPHAALASSQSCALQQAELHA